MKIVIFNISGDRKWLQILRQPLSLSLCLRSSSSSLHHHSPPVGEQPVGTSPASATVVPTLLLIVVPGFLFLSVPGVLVAPLEQGRYTHPHLAGRLCCWTVFSPVRLPPASTALVYCSVAPVLLSAALFCLSPPLFGIRPSAAVRLLPATP